MMSQYEELKARLKHIARLESVDYGAAPEDHSSHQAADAIESLERQLAEVNETHEFKVSECQSFYEEAELLKTQLATVTAQRDLLKDTATEAANDIRRCDYTKARSILLVALASPERRMKMDHSPLEHEVATLRIENAVLKGQVVQLQSVAQHETDCVEAASSTITQQALVIEQMRETILTKVTDQKYSDPCSVQERNWNAGVGSALVAIRKLTFLQPSPEILEARDHWAIAEFLARSGKWLTDETIRDARDQMIAEACAKVAAPDVGTSYDDYNLSIRNQIVKAIRSGEWRKYL